MIFFHCGGHGSNDATEIYRGKNEDVYGFATEHIISIYRSVLNYTDALISGKTKSLMTHLTLSKSRFEVFSIPILLVFEGCRKFKYDTLIYGPHVRSSRFNTMIVNAQEKGFASYNGDEMTIFGQRVEKAF